ncbi:hypothetical protein Hanom_Chr01g00045821 [Helianthus anomalus]
MESNRSIVQHLGRTYIRFRLHKCLKVSWVSRVNRACHAYGLDKLVVAHLETTAHLLWAGHQWVAHYHGGSCILGWTGLRWAIYSLRFHATLGLKLSLGRGVVVGHTNLGRIIN